MIKNMEEKKIVEFLLSRPDFFVKHADILNQITLGNPYGKPVISLAERQIQNLRQKNKLLENKLTDFLACGHQNDQLFKQLTLWSVYLIINANKQDFPHLLTAELISIFQISYAKILIFEEKNKEIFSEKSLTLKSIKNLNTFVQSLDKPYCDDDGHTGNIGWLFEQNESMKHLASIAILPLSRSKIEDMTINNSKKNINKTLAFNTTAKTSLHNFGLLLLGDKEKKRFPKGSNIDFLEHISILSSAALLKYTNRSKYK